MSSVFSNTVKMEESFPVEVCARNGVYVKVIHIFFSDSLAGDKFENSCLY